MKFKIKRALSLLAALAMCLSLMSIAAFAEDEPAAKEPVIVTASEEAADAEDEAEEELPQLPELFPAEGYTTSREAGGYKVTVTVEAESFTVDALFRVIEVTDVSIKEALGYGEDDTLLDIGFINEFGGDAEPVKPIKMSIESLAKETFDVIHFEDNETPVTVAEEKDTVAEFTVDSCSYFILASGATDSENKIQAGDKTYQSLTDAFNGVDPVASGETVTLLSDIELPETTLHRTQYHDITIDGQGKYTIKLTGDVTQDSGYWLFFKDVTIDLNGHTFTLAGNGNVRFETGTTEFKDTSEVGTGKVSGWMYVNPNASDNATLKISGGTFDELRGGNIEMSGGKVEVVNRTISRSKIHHNGRRV